MSLPSRPADQAAVTYPTVALIAPGELFGGAERQIAALVAELCRRKVPVQLALFHDGELARRLRSSGVEPTILASTLDVARIWMPALRSGKGDVVLHVHGYRAMVAVAIGSVAGRMRVVKTEHGLPERPRTLSGQLRARLYNFLDLVATRSVQATVVYVTRELASRAPRLVRGLSSAVVHNGIECLERNDLARPSEYSRQGSNIAWVGRLEPIKRPDVALEVIGHARHESPVMLHLVGDGPLAGEVRLAAADPALRDRVQVHGFRKDARSFIAHADAILITSDHEGLPYVVLEAMALRVPIVATAVGGLAEVLEDGSSALLFQAGDAGWGAQQIDRILKDPGFREQLVSVAEATYRNRFTSAAMCDAYLDIYLHSGR